MDAHPTPESPLKKATRLAVIYTGAALLGFVLLGYIYTSLPGNFFLLSQDSSQLKSWMLPANDFPSGMRLLEEEVTTNQKIADQYKNSKEMLKTIDSWGRVEGLSHYYLPQKICTQGLFSEISESVILHEDSAGAMRHIAWSKEEDRGLSERLVDVQVGDGGYETWNNFTSRCSQNEQSRAVTIFFQRNQALGWISVEALTSQIGEGDIEREASDLAHKLDNLLIQKTAKENTK